MDVEQDGSLCDLCFKMKLKSKAETICNTCDIRLCKECVGHHITNKISFRHDVVPFNFHETLDVVLSCKKHDEQLCNIYCDQCETSICLKCLSSGLHKDHTIQTLSEACCLKQEYIRTQHENIKSSILPAYRFALQEIENLISKVTIAHKQRQNAIDELEKEFRKIADDIVSKYRTEAKTAEEKEIIQLHTLKDEYQNKISSINEVIKEFEVLFSSEVPTGILSYSSRHTSLEVPDKLKIVIDIPDFHPKFLSEDEFCKLIGCLPSSSIDIREEKKSTPNVICSSQLDVKDSVRIKVFFYHPREKRKIEQTLEVHKDKTLREATAMCAELFCINKSTPLDCCRLLKFDEKQDTLEYSFEDEEDTPMGLLLGGVKQAYNFDLLLETKRPEQVFPEYKSGGLTVKLYVADLQNDVIQESPIIVRAYHTQTVAEFKRLVAKVLSVSAAQMRCVLKSFHDDHNFLSVPNKTLNSEGFAKSNKVYVEYSGEEDTTHFTHTHFFRLLDRHQNTIRIHVNLPSTSDVEDFLKSNSRHEQQLKNTITNAKSREDSSTSLEIRSKNGSDSLDEGISDRGSDSEIDFKLKKSDRQDELVEHGESDSEQNLDSDFDNDVTITKEEVTKRYFHIVHIVLDLLTKQRNLTVLVDKRITLGAFKKELEPHVGTSSDNFKVYRVYSNNQEFESIRLTETLAFFEDGKLNIQLGRALKPGEYRVKIYQLLLNNAEPWKFLIETIFAKGMSVLESKKLIIPKIKEQCGIDISLDRCRLRKKTWRNPGTVYFDNQIYEDEVHIFANWEVFLQILDGPEEMNTTSQLAIFVRRWRPSTYELDPFQEVILSSQTVDDLIYKISEISGIPVEDIEYAKGRGTFPCYISLLEIHSDLDWNPHVTSLNSWPLYICNDGCVLYYRDKTEKAELSESRKKELQLKENAR